MFPEQLQPATYRSCYILTQWNEPPIDFKSVHCDCCWVFQRVKHPRCLSTTVGHGTSAAMSILRDTWLHLVSITDSFKDDLWKHMLTFECVFFNWMFYYDKHHLCIGKYFFINVLLLFFFVRDLERVISPVTVNVYLFSGQSMIDMDAGG